MPSDATPDLRPFLSRLIDRVLHVPRPSDAPPDHCHHVTEMAVTVRVHNKLLFIVISAVVMMLVKWAAGEVSSRLGIGMPPPNQSERMGADRVSRPSTP